MFIHTAIRSACAFALLGLASAIARKSLRAVDEDDDIMSSGVDDGDADGAKYGDWVGGGGSGVEEAGLYRDAADR